MVGGGPFGACAAEIFMHEINIDTVFFERKMDNAKPCGGAIPLCMVGMTMDVDVIVGAAMDAGGDNFCNVFQELYQDLGRKDEVL